MSYRAVVFDLYGTLVDDLPREEYREVLSRMAEMFSLSADEFVEAWQQTGARRTVGDFTTVEECIAHVCHALGVEVDAERRLDGDADVRDLVGDAAQQRQQPCDEEPPHPPRAVFDRPSKASGSQNPGRPNGSTTRST